MENGEIPANAITDFGTTDGKAHAKLITLKNKAGLMLRLTDFGARMVALCCPDRDGAQADIITGFDDAKGYLRCRYHGGTIGRYANRIGSARFVLNGKTYSVGANEGENSLHGGFSGFDIRLWALSELGSDRVTFSLVSPDGDEGFPGELKVSVTYTLLYDGVRITYVARSDADTVFNPTNHAYFNLNGHAAGSIEAHVLTLNAHAYTPVGRGLLPLGDICTVEGTPFDFTVPHAIGERIAEKDEQLMLGGGYDHNFCVDGVGMREFAQLYSPHTGRALKVRSDMPGLQFYSGNFLADGPGKGGVTYGRRGALALETQFFPDSLNRAEPGFTKPILRAGDTFTSCTEYLLSIE